MFRNALRQSSRTVGAISASGRVAAVRALSPRPKGAQCHLDRSLQHRTSQLTRWSDADRWLGAAGELPTALLSMFFRPSVNSTGLTFSVTGTNCRASCPQRSSKAGPKLRCRRKGLAHRGLLHPRAENSRCSRGIRSRRDWTCSLRRVRSQPQGASSVIKA
jgi:hypothetical protein